MFDCRISSLCNAFLLWKVTLSGLAIHAELCHCDHLLLEDPIKEYVTVILTGSGRGNSQKCLTSTEELLHIDY